MSLNKGWERKFTLTNVEFLPGGMTPQHDSVQGLKWVCFGSSEKGNKILTGAIRETMCGIETEVRATQRLPYLGIHPMIS